MCQDEERVADTSTSPTRKRGTARSVVIAAFFGGAELAPPRLRVGLVYNLTYMQCLLQRRGFRQAVVP